MRAQTGGIAIISIVALGAAVFSQSAAQPAGASKSTTAAIRPAQGPALTGLQTGTAYEPASKPLTQAVFTPPACYMDAYSLVQEFFGASSEPTTSGPRDVMLLANEKGADLDFLTATVPDPIDSRSGWRYDLAVDSIQRALEANNYVQDRFSLPWKCLSDRANAAASVPTAASSTLTAISPLPNEPRLGIVLFRRYSRQSPRPKLLVLFLVGETPTSGIDKEALTTALDTMYACTNWNREVRLLGPFASGASFSLWLAIKSWCEKLAPATSAARADSVLAQPNQSAANRQQVHFRIISGSATNYENKETLERDIGGQTLIDFHATVVPDNTMLAKFKDYLHTFDPEARVALLAETNTGYSKSFQKKLKISRGSDDSSDDGSNIAQSQERGQDDWLVLPFPMYISQLRSAYEKNRPTTQQQPDAINPIPNSDRPALSVPLAETEDSRDVPPAFTPGMTTGVVDLDLQNLLSTISREGRNYVGLLATDTRDKLFLAEQIKKYCPDVRLFTFESDLLYNHPDFNSYLNGMIVVSSYPLFNQNQTWTSWMGAEFSRDRRLQFPMQTAEGVYNATLALLDYDASGTIQEGGRGLIEYGAPFASPASAGLSAPPVWITVVGRGASWPLKIYGDTISSDRNSENTYVFAASGFSVSTRIRGLFERARFGLHSILFWLLSLMFVANCLAFWKASGPMLKASARLRAFLAKVVEEAPGPLRKHLPSFEQTADAAARSEEQPDIGDNAPPLVRVFERPANHKHIYGFWIFSYFAILASSYAAIASVSLLPYFLSPLETGDGVPVSNVAKVLAADLVLFALVVTTLAAFVRMIWPETNLTGQNIDASTPQRSVISRYRTPALLVAGAVAFVAAISWSVNHSAQSHKADWITLYYRSTSLGSGVSPLAPVALLGAGLCIGCLLKLQRLRALNHSQLKLPLTGKGGLHDAGIDKLANRIEYMLEAPFATLSKLAVLIIVIILFAIPFRIAWVRFIPTFDGPVFDWTIKIALGLLYLGLVLGFVQALALWRQFRRLLHRLAQHPIAEAFDRLPSSPPHFIGQFWGRLPGIEQLQRPAQELVVLLKRYPILVQQLKEHSETYQSGDDTEKKIADTFAQALTAEASEPKLRKWFSFSLRNGGPVSVNQSEPNSPEGSLAAQVRTLVLAVEPLWAQSSPCQSGNGSSQKPEEETSNRTNRSWQGPTLPEETAEGKKWAEDLIAAQTVAFITRIFARLRNLLSFVMAAAFLILFAVKSYPFQPQQLLSIFMWAVILSVVLASVTMLTQAERDEALSRIAKTDPNQINLDSRFVTSIVTYGVVPLLGLLFTQIPQLQGVFSFIEPILRAFK